MGPSGEHRQHKRLVEKPTRSWQCSSGFPRINTETSGAGLQWWHSSFSRINIYATIHTCMCSRRTSMGAPLKDSVRTGWRHSSYTSKIQPWLLHQDDAEGSVRSHCLVLAEYQIVWSTTDASPVFSPAWGSVMGHTGQPLEKSQCNHPRRNHPTELWWNSVKPREPYLPPFHSR